MNERLDAEKSSEPVLDDRSIVEACLRGDPEAWEALILRYQRLIYSIPIRLGFSPVDAADIFQSVCVRLFEHLSSVRDYEKLSSWLMTTTTRECWRVIGERRREGQPSIYGEGYEADILDRLASVEPLAEQQRMAFELQQMLRQAVAALPERCRKLITLLFYSKEDLSYSEVARRMKLPLNSIGPIRARCLLKLKKMLEKKL